MPSALTVRVQVRFTKKEAQNVMKRLVIGRDSTGRFITFRKALSFLKTGYLEELAWGQDTVSEYRSELKRKGMVWVRP